MLTVNMACVTMYWKRALSDNPNLRVPQIGSKLWCMCSYTIYNCS